MVEWAFSVGSCAAKRGQEAPPEPEQEATVSQIVRVGRQIRERVKAGEELDDGTILDLILMAIEAIDPSPAKFIVI
eukprot:scaffold292987_cov19-Prasinocladus_malaysianus.AAC.2